MKILKTTQTPTKVLVVDDEPDLETLICQKMHHRTKTGELKFFFAHNGVEALKTLEENQDLDIILTDINMPEMDGLTLLGKLPMLGRVYQAIVISAYGDMANIRTAMRRGAFDFITKPINFDDFEETLDKTIEHYKLVKEALYSKKQLGFLERELEISRNIQQAMLPASFKSPIKHPDFEILGKMMPAKQVGGDFFDFFLIDQDNIGLVIADVSGKSISAALFMAISKGRIRSAAMEYLTPSSVLKEVNLFLSKENKSMMFVTCFYGVLNTKTKTLTYCNAGHIPPYIVSPQGQTSCLKRDGIVLGVSAWASGKGAKKYNDHTVKLKDEDYLILFTDGIIDAINSEYQLYSSKRLEKSLKQLDHLSLEKVIEHVFKDVERFSEGAEQLDDMAILCAHFKKEKNND